MKIAQIAPLSEPIPPKNKNGLEFVVHFLTEELAKRGHEITLFASANSKTSANLESVFPKNISNDPNASWTPYTYNLWNSFNCFSKINQFDIIHTHSFGAESAFFSYFVNTPVLTTIHSQKRETPIYKKDKRYFKYSKPIFDFLYKQNRVFVSKAQQNSYKYFKNAYVVHNGIPAEQFAFSGHSYDYFAYLGYLNCQKGAHTAVRVAKKAKIKLKLAGNGTKEFLEKEIYPYLDENIEYLGPVSGKNKIKFLQNAKALLVPIQWEEPFGLIMPEAMACGTPVIAFNRAAVPEIVKDGETGFIVKNEEEMIKAIKKIDSIDRKKCRERVEKYFTVEKMADEYEKIYQKIIEKSKK